MTDDQYPLLQDSPEDALVAMVFALGGWQKTAQIIWPTENPITQGDKLRRVLTTNARDRYTLREWIAIFGAGRRINCHTGVAGVMDAAGYLVTPKDPQVEEAKALNAVESATEALRDALQTLERVKGA